MNTKSKEMFEKFVQYHNKWQLKRHSQGKTLYSDYDSMAGLSMIMIPISFIFINSFFGIISISLMILFMLMNNTIITPIEKEGNENPSKKSTKSNRKVVSVEADNNNKK